MKNMRKSICLVLVAMIAFGCFVPVFADDEEPEKEYVRIVTLGDSNMTGYGLAEFWENSDYSACNAFNRVVPGAYADRLIKGLEEDGYIVDLDQLAMSAFRAYDLRLLLDTSLPEDWYFTNLVARSGYLDKMILGTPYLYQVDTLSAEEKKDILHSYYQDRIREADVVTVGLGGNEFTTLSLAIAGRDMDAFGIDPVPQSEYGRFLIDAENRILEAVSKLLAGTKYAELNGVESTAVKNTLKLMRSGYIGLTWNTDMVFREIWEMNPEAEIVYIPCAPIIPENFVMETEDGYEIPIGMLTKLLYDMVSEYHTTLSPYAGKIAYADTAVRYPGQTQADEFAASTSFGDLSGDTKRSMLETLKTIRVVLAAQDYSGLSQEVQLKTALNLGKLNAISSVADRAQSGRTFGLLRDTFQRGLISFELSKQRIADLPNVVIDPSLAADMASYLITGTLSDGDEDGARLHEVQSYLNFFMLYGADSSTMHPSQAGHAAHADAVIYAMENDMNAREYVWTERREATKEFAKEAAETTREVMKEAAEKTEEIVKEVGKAAIEKAAEVREAVRERAAEVRTNLREAVKSFLTRGR